VETGDVTRLTNDLSVGAWNLLDIRKDLVLAACSSPSQPPYLVIGKLPSVGEPMTIKWLRLDVEPEPLPQVIILLRFTDILVIRFLLYFSLALECCKVELDFTGCLPCCCPVSVYQ